MIFIDICFSSMKEEISVCNPSHYGDRFVRFLSHRVFRKGLSIDMLISIIQPCHLFLGGPKGNTLLSDTLSNTDRITLHSSR